jgi:hypothetical protein
MRAFSPPRVPAATLTDSLCPMRRTVLDSQLQKSRIRLGSDTAAALMRDPMRSGTQMQSSTNPTPLITVAARGALGRQPTIPLHPPGISEAIEFIPAIEPLC